MSKYETTAGLPTVGMEYAQLHERLIGCQENASMLAHLVRSQGGSKDNALADGWIAISLMLKQIDTKVTELATSRLN